MLDSQIGTTNLMITNVKNYETIKKSKILNIQKYSFLLFLDHLKRSQIFKCNIFQ